MFAFDIGASGYLYPGGQCFNSAASRAPAFPAPKHSRLNGNLPLNGNVAKRSAQLHEVYGKVNITPNDQFAVGLNEYFACELLNPRRSATTPSITGKRTAPSTTFGSPASACTFPEFGRQWLGTSTPSMAS
jgi:hypothetical protein